MSLDLSSATGQLKLLAYIPDRSKQQGRRFPLASISQALAIRFKRVSSRLADSIHWIQSLRTTGVMSDHTARAFGWAAARAFRRSAGTLGSGSSATGAISSETTSPASAPAASRNFRSTLSQWPPWPSGSSVARKATPLKVPSTDVMPREGSFALASSGSVRKVQATAFAVATGRNSVALKRILEAAVESPSASLGTVCSRATCPWPPASPCSLSSFVPFREKTTKVDGVLLLPSLPGAIPIEPTIVTETWFGAINYVCVKDSERSTDSKVAMLLTVATYQGYPLHAPVGLGWEKSYSVSGPAAADY